MTRSSVSILLITASLSLTAGSHRVLAACSDRPGTPDQVTATPLQIIPSRTTPSIKLTWRNTTRRGVFAVPGGFFDISVTDAAGHSVGHDITGGAFQGNNYGTQGSYTLEKLPPNGTLCFKIRARTEGGTQGCVSQQWSERVCATLSGASAKADWMAIAGDQKGHWAWGLGKPTPGDAEEVALANCNFGCKILAQKQGRCFAIAESKPSGSPWAISTANDIGTAQIDAERACSAKAPGTCKGVKALCSN